MPTDPAKPYAGKDFAFLLPKYSETYRNAYPTIPADDESLAHMVWTELQKLTDRFYKIDMNVIKFKDSAGKILNPEHVRGRDIYVVHSPCVDKILHTEIACGMADELRRSEAGKIYLFDTYEATFRQDKRLTRESVDARWTADKYEEATINRVFTFHPHTPEIQMAFSRRCPLDPFSLNNIFADKIYHLFSKNLNLVAFCASDEGSYGENEEIANMYYDRHHTPLASLRMRRDSKRPDKKEIVGFVGNPKTDVTGRIVVVREDVLGTGGTMLEVVEYLNGVKPDAHGHYICGNNAEEAKKFRPKAIILAPSHLDLCKGSTIDEERNSQEKIRKSGAIVLSTNTIVHKYAQSVDKLKSLLTDTPIDKILEKNLNPFYTIDLSPYIAKIIHCHSERESLSEFFRKQRSVVEEDMNREFMSPETKTRPAGETSPFPQQVRP